MLRPILITLRRVLIAADNALNFAAEAGNRRSRVVDKKFRKAVQLLGDFETGFLSKHPTSDQNVGVTVSNMSHDEFKFALWIVYVLKKNLHAKVKFPSVSLPQH